MPPDPNEIIVIPSDTEDEKDARPGVKKRRRSKDGEGCSSQSFRKVVREKEVEIVDIKEESKDIMMVHSEALTTEVSSFGLPNESLLPSKQPSTSHVFDLPVLSPRADEDSSFGVPTLLLGHSTAACSKTCPVNAEAGPSTLVRECSNLDVKHNTDSTQFEEDWIMDDDEAIKNDDAEDEIEFVYSQPRPITPQNEPFASKQKLRPLSVLAPSLQCPNSASTSCDEENAYSVLMASNKENEAWKEAQSAEDTSFRSSKSNGRRKAPFYKVLQGMPIAVDAFRYGAIPEVNAYFLTLVPVVVAGTRIHIYIQTRALRPLHKFVFLMEEWSHILLRGNRESNQTYAESRPQMGTSATHGCPDGDTQHRRCPCYAH